MSARAIVGGILTSGAILGIATGVGVAAHPSVSVGVGTTGTIGTGASSGSSSGSSGSGSTSGSSGSGADGSYTGQSVNTPFGSVQVQVTVSGGKIADVTALHLTDADGRSRQISDYAAPILHDEVLSAQSANVQMVGGATYTSEGYLMSLQSALDQAGL
ncbi:MAG TPA: FMN-binding protein [Pseudolysinimonas sp.]|nr:FMN-binding protein [Pseudolysinimonas sp.]